MAIKAYISPANHYKPYIIKGYTEKEQMDKLAPLLVKELERYEGIEPILTTIYNPDRQYTGRPEEAKSLGCDLYVALHTNAGGGKGACVFYHPWMPLSKTVALSVVKELNRICPIKSNRAVQPAIYAWNRQFFNFGELREPAKYGITPILIEHEFHDTVEGAQWIIDSLEDIAKANAKAIADALGLKQKLFVGDVNGDGKIDTLDAAMILKHDAGLVELSEEQQVRADVNQDGDVDTLDASTILKHDAGLIDINTKVAIKEDEIAIGDTIKVKKTATHYGAKNGNKRIASFIPGKTFTVYGMDGEQVLIGLNKVYTGWVNKTDIEQLS